MTTQTNHNAEHNTGPIVVKLGGALLENAPALKTVAKGIAIYSSAHPGKLVILHGGGSIADKKLADAGISLPKHRGLRVTPPRAMPLIIEAFKGTANAGLVAALDAAGLSPIGLTLTDAGTLRIQAKESPEVDLGLVGTPAPGDPSFINAALTSGHTPVLCTIGLDKTHAWRNINADEAAGALAQTLDASAVLLLSDIPAVLDSSGSPLANINERTISTLIENGTITGGMIPKVSAALHAVKAASCPAIIAPWDAMDPIGSALAGSGTRVLPTSQEVLA